MPVNTKVIQNRIKSVSNIKKITKAMEMVAAVKMRKAVAAALDTRNYAQAAWDLLVNLSQNKITNVPLLTVRPVKKLLMIIITSNRGLCGSFNSNIIKKTAMVMKNPQNIAKQRVYGKEIENNNNLEIDVIGIGKKGASFCKKMGYNLIASFNDISNTLTLDDSLAISKMAIDAYTKTKYDKVVVAYTDFQSSINQVAKLRQVLPISQQDLEKMIYEVENEKKVTSDKNKDDNKQLKKLIGDSIFEPNREEVLKIILPRLVESQIFQAMLESVASEHSSRMLAMRNASDSAIDMIKELNLSFNKARQAGITQEIAEIAGGAIALE